MTWEWVTSLNIDGPIFTLPSKKPTYYDSDDDIHFDRMNHNNLMYFYQSIAHQYQIHLHRQWMHYVYTSLMYR